MIYYNARQRKDMRWDYACGNYPTGYCAAYREFTENDTWMSKEWRDSENAKFAVNKHKHHTCGHETEEEARNCYKEFLLDTQLRLVPNPVNPQQQFKCKVCKEWCSGYATIGQCEMYNLCEKHCTREEIEKFIGPAGEMWIS